MTEIQRIHMYDFLLVANFVMYHFMIQNPKQEIILNFRHNTYIKS